MKKIAIITLHGLYNYGNRLQNFAVQNLIEKRGFKAESVTCEKSRFNQFLHFANFCMRPLIGKDSFRYYNFLRFEKKHMKDRFVYNGKKQIPSSISGDYDAFVVGSDQVWNPEMRQRERSNFFLQFTKKEKRIALSPSISVDAIPDEWKDCYYKGLCGFEELSVREKRGAEIITELTGKDCTVLPDPTLAVKYEVWENLANSYKVPQKKYLLTYYLGKISPETQALINSTAEKNNLEVVHLNNLAYKKLHSIGPEGFLAYIKNANIVFTDSFHGCVFSSIFKIPFVACVRHNTDKKSAGIESRIYNLLEMLGLEDRMQDKLDEKSLFNISFDVAHKRIEQKRLEFDKYLNRQFERLELIK